MSTANPVKTVQPGEPALSSRFDRCSLVVQSYDIVDTSIEFAVEWAEAVIVGTVHEIGPGAYNTGGEALRGSDPVTPLDVYRPTLIRIDTVLSGELEPQVLNIRLPGGKVGCDEYAPDSSEGVVAGSRYVFFLSNYPDVKGNGINELTVTASWPVTDDGKVRTPYDGAVSLDALAELASHVAEGTAAPAPR